MDDEDKVLTREEEAVFREVLKALRQIKHGYIQIVVQDSKVIQIDKTEKVRFTPRSDNAYHI
ncbi:MAG: YezD family protein [Dehalococcoidia bacterium]|nr:YezD family protein [Dehalococcoidia bacterium]